MSTFLEAFNKNGGKWNYAGFTAHAPFPCDHFKGVPIGGTASCVMEPGEYISKDQADRLGYKVRKNEKPFSYIQNNKQIDLYRIEQLRDSNREPLTPLYPFDSLKNSQELLLKKAYAKFGMNVPSYNRYGRLFEEFKSAAEQRGLNGNLAAGLSMRFSGLFNPNVRQMPVIEPITNESQAKEQFKACASFAMEMSKDLDLVEIARAVNKDIKLEDPRNALKNLDKAVKNWKDGTKGAGSPVSALRKAVSSVSQESLNNKPNFIKPNRNREEMGIER